jgi:hypothetical protein
MAEADYIVLRHGLDLPDEYRSAPFEGLWIDRSDVAFDRQGTDPAVAEPAGRFEVRDDGVVAEVWEIRLTTPNEQRLG